MGGGSDHASKQAGAHDNSAAVFGNPDETTDCDADLTDATSTSTASSSSVMEHPDVGSQVAEELHQAASEQQAQHHEMGNGTAAAAPSHGEEEGQQDKNPPAFVVDGTGISETPDAISSLVTIRPDGLAVLDALNQRLGHVFELLQKQSGWRHPQIVVLGTESHGKSTLWIRLIGIDASPRASSLCTRVPIRIMMRRGQASDTLAVWIRELDEAGQPSGEILPDGTFPEHAQHVHRKNVLGHVTNLVQQVLRHLNNGQDVDRSVSLRHEIVMYLPGPQFPDVDLVDLPGVVTIGTQEDPNLPEKTKQMTRRYLQQHGEHSMFVLAADGRERENVNLVLPIIQECNVLDRTLIATTKCDLVMANPSDMDEDPPEGVDPVTQILLTMLQNVHSMPGYGRVLTASTGLNRKVACEEDALARSQAHEADYFSSKNIPLDSAGIRALCIAIWRGFGHYLRTTWAPLMTQELCRLFQRLNRDAQQLGTPFEQSEASAVPELNGPMAQELGYRADDAVGRDVLVNEIGKHMELLLQMHGYNMCSAAETWLHQITAPAREACRMLFDRHAELNRCAIAPSFEDLEVLEAARRSVKETFSQVANGLSKASSAGGTMHPLVQQIRDVFLSDDSVSPDETGFRLARFRDAIDVVCENLSGDMTQWMQECLTAIDVIQKALALKDSEVALLAVQGNNTGDRTLAAVQRTFAYQQLACVRLDCTLLLTCLERFKATVSAPSIWHKSITEQHVTDVLQQERVSMLTDLNNLLLAIGLLLRWQNRDSLPRRADDQAAGDDGEHHAEAAAPAHRRPARHRTVAEATLALAEKGSFVKLYNKGIDDDMATQIADRLRRNSDLKKLSMGSNQLTSRGARVLLEALHNHGSLNTVVLSNNRLDDSVEEVVKALINANPSVAVIDLKRNRLSERTIKSLRAFSREVAERRGGATLVQILG